MAWLETQPRSPTSLSLLGHQIWPYGTRQESFPIHDCWTFQTPIFMVDSHSSLVTATPFVKMHHVFWSLEAILQSSSKVLSKFHLEVNHSSHQFHNEPSECLQVLFFITQWALKDDIESFINHKLEQLSCFQKLIPNKGDPGPLLRAGMADLTSLRSTIPIATFILIPYAKGSLLELLPKSLVLKIGN